MDAIYSTFHYTQTATSWLLKPVTSCISDRVKKKAQSLLSTGCYTVQEKILLSAPKIAAGMGAGMTAAAYCVSPMQAIPVGLLYTGVWYACYNPPVPALKKEIHTLRLREKQTHSLEGLPFQKNCQADKNLLLQVIQEMEQEPWFENWMLSKTFFSAEAALPYCMDELQGGVCLGVTEITKQFLAEQQTHPSSTSLASYLLKNRSAIFKKQLIHVVACDLKNSRTFYKKLAPQAEAMLTTESQVKETIEGTTKTPSFPSSMQSLDPSASGSVHLSKPKTPKTSNHVFSFYTTKDHITLCDPHSSVVGIIQYPKKEIRLATLVKEHIQSYYGEEYASVCIKTWGTPLKATLTEAPAK